MNGRETRLHLCHTATIITAAVITRRLTILTHRIIPIHRIIQFIISTTIIITIIITRTCPGSLLHITANKHRQQLSRDRELLSVFISNIS
ncbi:hypothetical protein D3C72_691410 [compost metagenome]